MYRSPPPPWWRRWWVWAAAAVVLLAVAADGLVVTERRHRSHGRAVDDQHEGKSFDERRADDGELEPAGPDAAGDLVAFFAAVEVTDRDLRVAADAVNGSIGVDTVTFEQSTIDAIDRAEPTAAAAAIPAGLEPAVERRVARLQRPDVSVRLAENGVVHVPRDPPQVGSRPVVLLAGARRGGVHAGRCRCGTRRG